VRSSAMLRRATKRGSEADHAAGQAMVEFAMVIPFLIVLLMALLELALALNASMSVTRASQNGAHFAATAGNTAGADCLILQEVESHVSVPNNAANISEVVIERTALAGNLSYAQQKWARSGETTCTLPNGDEAKVPYSLIVNGYPESQRCSVLRGCPLMTPPRSTVDNIGVIIRYRHDWVTPLNGALDLIAGSSNDASGGWNFEQRNIFRIEPTL
jgi:Flp pilus assembly protein TadG